jgi:hypothetical protein
MRVPIYVCLLVLVSVEFSTGLETKAHLIPVKILETWLQGGHLGSEDRKGKEGILPHTRSLQEEHSSAPALSFTLWGPCQEVHLRL